MRRRGLRRLAGLALLLGGSLAHAARGQEPAPDGSALRKAYLEAEVEAAGSREIYLVYLPAEGRLELRAQGVLLRSFAVEEAALSRPRGGVGGPAAWPAVAFRLASELPERERPKIVPPGADEAGAPAASPPVRGTDGLLDFAGRERETLLATAPGRLRLRFEPGLEITVLAGGSAAGHPLVAALDAHAREAWRMLRRAPRPPALLLRLPDAEARRLYFSLTPGIRLLVAPPAPPA